MLSVFLLDLSDDGSIDNACFDLHMCLKLALKYMCECELGSYPFGHNIRNLINYMNNKGINLDVVNQFLNKSDVYTSWQTGMRYVDSVVAVKRDIDECVVMMDELIKYISDKYEAISQVDDDMYQWCLDNAPDAVKELPVDEMLSMMKPLYDTYKKR